MPQLRYANVVSTIALVAAVGGGTAIALDRINADKVDGLNAKRIDYVANANGPNPPFKKVFKQGGLVLRARCIEQSGHYLELEARTRVSNAEIQVGVISGGQFADVSHAIERDFDKGEVIDVGGITVASQGEYTLTYSTRKGSHVSAVFQTDVGSILGTDAAPDCLVGGTALHVPA
jgi:hypothetical protein